MRDQIRGGGTAQKPPQRRNDNRKVDTFARELTVLHPTLVSYAMRVAKNVDDAEDLAQETIAKALKNREKFADGSSLKAWTYAILRNTFISGIRRRAREVVDTELVAGDLAPATMGNQEDHMRLRAVAAGFAQLTPSARRLLLLVGAQGLTYERAAALEGCAIGTVKSRISRARQKLAVLSGEPTHPGLGDLD